MPITRSKFATFVDHPQDVTDRKVLKPWGVCVHTTGSGLPTRAKKLNIEPLALAVEIYCRPGANFPHYVMDYDGTIFQIADEKERARHAGIDPAERASYADGSWRKKVTKTALAHWEARWSGYASPLDLFPGGSVNEVYLGIELIPLLKPMPDGSKFTGNQYESLAAFLDDVENRHTLALNGPRLVSHEDIEPLTRWDSKGGWDVGALRAEPWFFWDRVFAQMR